MPERRSHILFLASWYPNRNAPALGNFIRQHALAAALHHKVSVVYACADPGLEPGKTEIVKTQADGLLEIVVYYGKIAGSGPLASWRKFRTYKSALLAGVDEAEKAHGAPDVLHLHVTWKAAVAVDAILGQWNIPLVISEHWSGYLPEDGNYKGRMMKRFTRRVAKRAQVITTVSQQMTDAMTAHGLIKSNAWHLDNCIDTDVFRPAEAKAQTENFRMVHVSMLVDREKNISGMLRVLARPGIDPSVSLEIIGDGPERAQHEKLAAELDLLDKTVFFSGLKDAQGVAEAMQKADALLLFSHFEGMPVTILEAQSCGLPVIATSVGYIPEMIGPDEGILVNPGDEHALEKAILDLRASRDRFSAAAIRKKIVDKYSREAVAQSLGTIYSSTRGQR